MKHLLRSVKYRTKIIILCAFILLFNSVIVGKLYYDYAFRDTLNNFYQSSEDISNQMNQHLSERFMRITNRAFTFSNNNSFYLPLNAYLSTPNAANHAKLLGVMSDAIGDLRKIDEYIHSVFIHTEFNDFDDFTRIRKHGFSFEESYMYQYFEEHPDESVSWFPEVISPIFTGQDKVLPVVYKFKMGRERLYIVISLSQYELGEYLKNTYSSYDKIFIVDENGENIANFSEEEAEVLPLLGEADLQGKKSVCKEVTYKGHKYLGTYTIIKANGWQIYSLKLVDSLLGNLSDLRVFIIGALIVSALISMFLSGVFAHNLTAPLARLVDIMDKTVKKEFHIQFPYPYEDEVGNLAKSFNYMVKEMDHLVKELNVNIEALKDEKENVQFVEMQKRKAELVALQAQINPHFLYNTLNAITWQAADQGASEISIMSNSLGKFFRIALSKGSGVITIEEEIEHVTNYLNIQKIRYKSKLSFEIDIADDIKELYIIKLVLQPLVENSIYHGIKLLDVPGTIKISASRRIQEGSIPTIWICIEDNGVGIEKDRLVLINQNLRKGIIDRETGYGIYNVNERIRLYYGAAYGLFFESNNPLGTKANLVIPIQTTREE